MGRERIITDTSLLAGTAFKIIDEVGFGNFSARKLAGVLGISHMTVYNYMDREELLNQVVIQAFSIMNGNIMPHVEECKTEHRDPNRIFSVIADELLVFAKTHQNIYKFVFLERIGAARDDPRLRALYMSGMEWVRDAIPADRFDSMYNDVYLFLVLINGLVLAYLNRQNDAAEAMCRNNMARAFKLILGHYCTDV
jgi:AcrR family transcriptional regulator